MSIRHKQTCQNEISKSIVRETRLFKRTVPMIVMADTPTQLALPRP